MIKYYCEACGKRMFCATDLRCIKSKAEVDILKSKYSSISKDSLLVCHGCRYFVSSNNNTNLDEQKIVLDNLSNENQLIVKSIGSSNPLNLPATFITLSMNRCSINQKKCNVCNKNQNLVRVFPDLRTQVFLKRELFVPPSAKCKLMLML